MKKVVVGVMAASLIFSQGLGIADAKGKGSKKTQKIVRVDKDKNGIDDSWQKKYKLGKSKSVATKDHDKDGLNNLHEYQLNLHPKLKDTDKDRLPDGQEDHDKDQLTNLQDIQSKMSPILADTDKDGVTDSKEDNDLDKLITKEEYTVGTNPTNADSDKDGMLDGKEDKDGDSLSNSTEFGWEYNPSNSDSDRNGIKDAEEDFNGDGIPNGSEVEELEIELVDVRGKDFKLEYELSEGEFELKIEDEIGILDAEMIVERLILTPNMTEEELVAQVKQVLGFDTFIKLTIEVEFANGEEIEVEYEVEESTQESEEDEE